MNSRAVDDATIDGQLKDPYRLSALRQLDLLDSAVEEAFDVMTGLATKLVAAPASFISLVDETRDFYKSQCGFPDELAAARELQGRTFCHYTLGQDDPLIIEDTLSDPVWRAVPTVKTLGVRAYIGVPIVVRGQHVGSFCVIDVQPRKWTPLQIETVVQLSRSAAREVVLRDKVRDAEVRATAAAEAARDHVGLLAAVAHDLRTPLQIVSLTAASLKELVDDHSASHVVRIEAANQSMVEMVDSLVAKHARGGQPTHLPVVIAADRLLADAAETMSVVAKHARIAIVNGPATSSRVEVDYATLLRVFANLIGNSIKYCPPGSSVKLTASDDGNDVVLNVADDGPGMSREEMASAFERGWRGAATAGREAGFGLGLGIARELVEQNDGRLQFDPTATVGTALTIRLPRRGHSA